MKMGQKKRFRFPAETKVGRVRRICVKFAYTQLSSYDARLETKSLLSREIKGERVWGTLPKSNDYMWWVIRAIT